MRIARGVVDVTLLWVWHLAGQTLWCSDSVRLMTWFQFDILWTEQAHCWTIEGIEVKVDVDEEKGAEVPFFFSHSNTSVLYYQISSALVYPPFLFVNLDDWLVSEALKPPSVGSQGKPLLLCVFIDCKHWIQTGHYLPNILSFAKCERIHIFN